jgi:hypothetical protein
MRLGCDHLGGGLHRLVHGDRRRCGMTKAAVTVVTWLLIGAAIVLSPLYGLWVAGGSICDARDRRC